MRMSARANPPTSPQFALPAPGPAKCLDISTTRLAFIFLTLIFMNAIFSSPTPYGNDGLEDIPEDSCHIVLQQKTNPKFPKASKDYCHRVSSAPSQ